MSFEQTNKYKAALGEIRAKPQTSEDENIEKRESAKEFRMEVMLDNARLMKNLVGQLEYNSWSTAEDLRTSVKKTAEYLAHPQFVEDFIDSLIKAKEVVEKILFSSANKNMGAEDVIGQFKPNYRPNGKVEVDLSYPLAVTIFVNTDEDFEALQGIKNSIGSFKQSSTFYLSANGTTREAIAPLIIVKGEKSTAEGVRIQKHESAHAQHHRLMTADNKPGDRKLIWLKPTLETINFNDLIKNYKSEKNAARRLENPDFKKCLNVALAYAKDEILAKVYDDPKNLADRINALQKKDGIYDYFSAKAFMNDMEIKSNKHLYNDLWDSYLKKLTPAVNILRGLVDLYISLNLPSRVQLMRWVFIQIPIQEWVAQINASGFMEEFEGLKELDSKNMLTENLNNFALQKALSQIRSTQSQSFLPALKEYFSSEASTN